MNIRALDNMTIANANTIIKGFSNSNQFQGDQHQNFTFCLLRICHLI